jgi:ribosomal protein S18 acetylase RimI-like enzyme
MATAVAATTPRRSVRLRAARAGMRAGMSHTTGGRGGGRLAVARTRTIARMEDDLRRALAFVRWLQVSTSTRVEPFRWGLALFHDAVPRRYFSNFVRVERPLVDVGVDDLVRETDRAMAGFDHRQIQVFDDADGGRLAPTLAHAGYVAEHNTMMSLRRAPDRPAATAAVDEVPHGQLRPFLVEVYRRDLSDSDAELAEPFADLRRAVQPAIGTRFFGRRIAGRIAGACELYVHDGVAQIEHVDTLAEFRGRGVARSVVSRAAEEARAEGADLVLIEADLADWPRHLYRRLGFDEIGRSWTFTRAPA